MTRVNVEVESWRAWSRQTRYLPQRAQIKAKAADAWVYLVVRLRYLRGLGARSEPHSARLAANARDRDQSYPNEGVKPPRESFLGL